MKTFFEFALLALVTITWLGVIVYAFGGIAYALPVLCSAAATAAIFAIFNRDLFR